MKVLNYWLYDSFAEVPFQGNVAALVEVEDFHAPDEALKIAQELCQKTTCFFHEKEGKIFTRSFSFDGGAKPVNHGLLAVAKHCLDAGDGVIVTESGSLNVSVVKNSVSVRLPKRQNIDASVPDRLNQYFDVSPVSVREFDKTCIVELRTAEEVEKLMPDFNRIAKIDCYDRVAITAEGNDSIDYVCRYFTPKLGVNENDSSLYAQTFLPVFWQEKLKKDEFSFIQLSSRRGRGKAKVLDDAIIVTAKVALAFKGELFLP